MRVERTRPDLANAIGRDKIPPPIVVATRLKVATFRDVFRRGEVKVGLKYSMDIRMDIRMNIRFGRTRRFNSSSELRMTIFTGKLQNLVNFSMPFVIKRK